MKQDIEIIRGTTNRFGISVVGPEGNPYEMPSGAVVRFGVKQSKTSDEYLLIKECTSAKDGVCEFAFSPGDTINIDLGRYLYDVGLEVGGDYFNIIEASSFLIKANITRHGD